jgi:hypothetical protein
MADADYDKRVADEAQLLYSTSVTEIAGFKQQQWHVANYALLLDATIVSFPKFVAPKLSQIEYVVLGIAALAVLIAGWVMVGMFSGSILLRRKRLTHIRKSHLTDEFRTSWRGGASETEMPDRPEEKVNLLIFFRTILSAGFAATIWLLIRSACAA